ncbi:SH3-domain kinase binding protein 1 [Actinomortierella wolfii]|nr:SH3-domain kinase binding protein 1 [Actinomortierella wolfii]
MSSEYIECFHPYEAEKDDELTLQVGDRLRVSDKTDPGWWIGERLKDGQSGWFPSNFVNPVQDSSLEAPAQAAVEQAAATKTTTEATTADATDAAQETPTPAEDASAAPKDTGPILARVEYDYEPKEPGELSLEAGRVITILDKSDPAWWSGDCNGKVGIFPSNYVKLIEKDESAEKSHKFKLAAFGVKQGGLGSLFAGGVVPGLKKTGGLRKTGIDITTGKRTSTDEPRSPVASTPAVPKATHSVQPAAAHAPAPAHVLPPPPAPAPAPASVHEPAATLPASPAPATTPSSVSSTLPEEAASPSSAEPRVPSRAKKPKAKQTKALVMYDYTAQEEDEISLVKGTTVVITDRMGDEGWWAGRDEQGNIGNFPSDFVQIIKDETPEPSVPALPPPAAPLPTPNELAHAPAPAADPVPAAVPASTSETLSPKVASPPPLPIHAPVPVPIPAQPMTATSPSETQRPELPRTRTNDSARAVPPPIPKTSRPPSMVATPPPTSPRVVEQRPLHEIPPPLPSSPPPKRMSISSRSNSMDQAVSPRSASRPPSVVLPAVPLPEPVSESLSRSNTAKRPQVPIPEAPVEEEQQDEKPHDAEPAASSADKASYILPTPTARSRPLPPLARPPSIHQDNRRSLVLPAVPSEASEVSHDLQSIQESNAKEDEEVVPAADGSEEKSQAPTETVIENHAEQEESSTKESETAENVPEAEAPENNEQQEHQDSTAAVHAAAESSTQKTQDEQEKQVQENEETEHVEKSAESEAPVDNEPAPAPEPEKAALPEISASGPSLSHASRPRPAKGRKLPSVPIPSQDESFSAKLEAEVKAAPIPEESKKSEEVPSPSTTPEKPGPPPKPIKPIFSKFPTPFAGAQPVAVSLRPTGRRPEASESQQGGTPPSSSSSTPSTGAPATTTPPVGGVKSLSSRFNQFQGVPSGGNTGHLELEIAKLKRYMNEELDRVRRELSEEREKREQLEAEVKELKQRLSSA